MNNYLEALELLGTIFSILFCVLVIREHISCWIFGILASIISVVVFFHAKLYAECILSTYYIWVGVYGWWYWAKQTQVLSISEWNRNQHLKAILIGLCLSAVIAWILATYTDAANPYRDTLITIFSFIASYKEAKKVLSGWIYWTLINGSSVILYFQRDLNYYGFLAILYTGLSVWGYVQWRRKMLTA